MSKEAQEVLKVHHDLVLLWYKMMERLQHGRNQ